jgi:hypothetical protein
MPKTKGDTRSVGARAARLALRALGGWRYVGAVPEPRGMMLG